MLFSFGRRHVARIESVRDAIVLILARTKTELPPGVAKELGDLVRACNEIIGHHVNLWPWGA